MNRSRSRFKNHLDDNLVHIHKNLYISPGDPLYYEKVIRYLDPNSPEAHFKLGQKNQKKGNLPKAKFHYQETLRTYPSPY
jgi:tetratricopeptide (TPR) repeat protein